MGNREGPIAHLVAGHPGEAERAARAAAVGSVGVEARDPDQPPQSGLVSDHQRAAAVAVGDAVDSSARSVVGAHVDAAVEVLRGVVEIGGALAVAQHVVVGRPQVRVVLRACVVVVPVAPAHGRTPGVPVCGSADHGGRYGDGPVEEEHGDVVERVVTVDAGLWQVDLGVDDHPGHVPALALRGDQLVAATDQRREAVRGPRGPLIAADDAVGGGQDALWRDKHSGAHAAIDVIGAGGQRIDESRHPRPLVVRGVVAPGDAARGPGAGCRLALSAPRERISAHAAATPKD